MNFAMSLEIYIPDFDEHHIADDCDVRDLREWGQMWILLKKLVRNDFKKYRWVFPIKNMAGYLEERRLINEAQKRLADFILKGGNQGVSLADYTLPSIFDPNTHNPSSIVRIERDGFYYSRLYHSPQFREIFGEYEQSSGAISGQHWLGVISDMKFRRRRVIICFQEDEKEITIGHPIHKILDCPITIGRWDHAAEDMLPSQMIPLSLDSVRLECYKVHARLDSFDRVSRITVLQVGKPIMKENKNMQLGLNNLVKVNWA